MKQTALGTIPAFWRTDPVHLKSCFQATYAYSKPTRSRTSVYCKKCEASAPHGRLCVKLLRGLLATCATTGDSPLYASFFSEAPYANTMRGSASVLRILAHARQLPHRTFGCSQVAEVAAWWLQSGRTHELPSGRTHRRSGIASGSCAH